MAQEEGTVSADSSAGTSEPAPVTNPSIEPAAVDSSTSDGSIAASPAESEAK